MCHGVLKVPAVYISHSSTLEIRKQPGFANPSSSARTCSTGFRIILCSPVGSRSPDCLLHYVVHTHPLYPCRNFVLSLRMRTLLGQPSREAIPDVITQGIRSCTDNRWSPHAYIVTRVRVELIPEFRSWRNEIHVLLTALFPLLASS